MRSCTVPFATMDFVFMSFADEASLEVAVEGFFAISSSPVCSTSFFGSDLSRTSSGLAA